MLQGNLTSDRFMPRLGSAFAGHSFPQCFAASGQYGAGGGFAAGVDHERDILMGGKIFRHF